MNNNIKKNKYIIKSLFLMFFAFIPTIITTNTIASTQDYLFKKNGCIKKTFTITSYYSPLKGQSFYNKDSFKEEIILNGKGTHGANGKAVFNGMLAAPQSYEFGIKIYFPERGWGEIADRGGAIVEAGKRQRKNDRIDIRMGKGEKGLIRALTWGVKDIKARVCPKSINIKKLNIVKYKQIGLNWDKLPIYKHFFLMSLFLKELHFGNKSIWVKELQNQLIKLGYMKKGRNTGFFGEETKKAVCNFQLNNKIVSIGSERCGYYGPRTRYKLKQILKQKKMLPIDFWSVSSFEYLHNYAIGKTKNNKETKNIKKRLFSKISNILLDFKFNKPFHKGDKNDNVIILQHKLTSIGYPVAPTGYYGDQTISAIKKFQKAHGLIRSGYLDKKTRKLLNKIKL